jgi:hypothetical protein
MLNKAIGEGGNHWANHAMGTGGSGALITIADGLGGPVGSGKSRGVAWEAEGYHGSGGAWEGVGGSRAEIIRIRWRADRKRKGGGNNC